MRRTNKDRILDYLRSVSPKRVTNSDIREATDVRPHQQVFQITQNLRQSGVVQAARRGREWVFWIDKPSAKPTATPPPPPDPTRRVASAMHRERTRRAAGDPAALDPAAFEQLARSVMSIHLGVPLTAGSVPGVPKEFDMVSPDRETVGDAKYYTMVQGKRLPPAKFATIAEHVWLLEKTGAPTKFLVFGNQRQVPMEWLMRYGDLAADVDFYFLSDGGELERMTGSE